VLRGVDYWLVVAVALGAWLRFARLGDFHNQYYTATTASMLESPKNFFFGSFDPGGVVTVDKPPFAFWVDAIPAAIWGVKAWTVTLPQVLMGVLAIIILYAVIKLAFGRIAALVSAFLLAVIPASVLIDSRNEPDALLSFALLLAAVSIVQSVRTGRWLWLFSFALCMAVAFNAKMLVAVVPLPAFLLYYALAAKVPVRELAARAAILAAVALVLAFSWATAVALTPKSDRPYIGSTRDNSIWTLIFEYNGTNRFRNFGGPGPGPQPGIQQPGQPPGQPQQSIGPPPQGGVPPPPIGLQPLQPPGPGSQQPIPQQGRQRPPGQNVPGQQPPLGGRPQQPNQPGGFQQPGQLPGPGPQQPGQPRARNGIFGLFFGRLASQLAWLLPLGIFAAIVAFAKLFDESLYSRPSSIARHLRESPIAAQSFLWVGWFATAVIVLGLADATTTHPYYLVALAVPLAAVCGIAAGALLEIFRRGGLPAWLLPVALAATALYQALQARGQAEDWVVALAFLAGLTAIVPVVVGLWHKLSDTPLAKGAALASACVLLVIPSALSYTAGGQIVGGGGPRPPGRPAAPNPEAQRLQRVAGYIKQRSDAGSKFVVGAFSAREAAPFIIDGVPAVAIGGFSGNDPIFTLETFQAMVRRGELRYFLLSQGNPGAPTGGQAQRAQIMNYIRSQWQDVSQEAGLPGGTLYRARD
jgi:4-amino-4-deoxy-L-arabinose transferase-like glycosyltransferase